MDPRTAEVYCFRLNINTATVYQYWAIDFHLPLSLVHQEEINVLQLTRGSVPEKQQRRKTLKADYVVIQQMFLFAYDFVFSCDLIDTPKQNQSHNLCKSVRGG